MPSARWAGLWSCRLACSVAALLAPVTVLPATEAGPQSAPSTPALDALAARHAEIFRRTAPAVAAVECRAGTHQERFYGSGVSLSPSGVLLTLASAIPEGAREIRVRFRDGRECAAEVLERDAESEAVALRLKTPKGAPPWPCVPLGRADSARAGDLVYAAGNPHHTLSRDGQVFWSAGILSGKYAASAEAGSGGAGRGPVFETDASVNHGCDGGPLLDAGGRLLGLLSLRYSRTRWLGTALPLERAARALPATFRLLAAESASTPPVEETDAGGTEAVLRAVARRAAPAVVRLLVHRAAPNGSPEQDAPAAPVLAVDRRTALAREQARRPAGAVSGVLVQPPGTILTSAFNVEGAEGTVGVELADGRRAEARIEGRHLGLDLAVLTLAGLPEESLPALELGGDEELRAGHFVAALGAAPDNAAQNEPTRTAGIVSALRRLEGQAVQMDAGTNYGNAGGPVLDLHGRLVGVVTQVGTRKVWAQNSGVGFFAPAHAIRAALPELHDGRALLPPAQPFLGVRPAVGESHLEGVKLVEAAEDAAAYRAGLRADDIITALDGKPARSWPALLALLQNYRPGETLCVSFVRAGEPKEARVVLDERKDE